MSRKPNRGDVFWVNLDPAIGTEAKKTRPAAILSSNAQNAAGQRVLAAPITSNVSRVYSFEALVDLGGKPGKAMLDQVRCLDQSRLAGYICALSAEDMKQIEKAIRIAFDLV